jgi:hypothetical protein
MRSLLNCATREELLKRQKCSPEDKKMKVGKKGLRADTWTESRVICVIIEVTQGDYLGVFHLGKRSTYGQAREGCKVSGRHGARLTFRSHQPTDLEVLTNVFVRCYHLSCLHSPTSQKYCYKKGNLFGGSLTQCPRMRVNLGHCTCCDLLSKCIRLSVQPRGWKVLSVPHAARA